MLPNPHGGLPLVSCPHLLIQYLFFFFNWHCNPCGLWPAQLSLSILSRKVFTECRCQQHLKPPTWRAYSIYLQKPPMLEAVPPSATWGCTMPWWQTHLPQPCSALLLFFNSRLLLGGCLLVSPHLDKRSKRFTSALYEWWAEGTLVWSYVPYCYNSMCLIIILILSFNFNFQFTIEGNSKRVKYKLTLQIYWNTKHWISLHLREERTWIMTLLYKISK